MIPMLRVEIRKLFRRKEIYILTALLLFASFFVISQLVAKNPILTIETKPGSPPIPLAEFTQVMISILNSSGILIAFLAVITWNIIGKETDQKVIAHYLVHSKRRIHVYFAKILITLSVIAFLFLVFLSSILLFANIFKPEIIDLTLSRSDMAELGRMFVLNMFMFLIYTLCAFFFSLYFGSMGTLIGTIGVSLGLTFLKFIEGTDRFNPVILNDIFQVESFSRNLWLNVLYVVVLMILFTIISSRKDIK